MRLSYAFVRRRLRGGLLRAALTATITAATTLLTVTAPAHAGGVDYAAAASDEAYWISLAQVPDGHGSMSGAIAMTVPAGGITNTTDSLVRPYLANLAVPGLIAGGPRYLPMAKAYLNWYLHHLQWPDQFGVHGTVCDYRINVVTGVESYADPYGNISDTCYYDSSDAYAGTFLMAMKAYAQANPADYAWVASWQYELESISSVIQATRQSDGLTWAKPNWPVKYLMDNVEAEQGLEAMSWLDRNVIGDASKADYAAGEANIMATGIQSHLYLPSVGMYANDADAAAACTAGGTCPDWNTWYPNGEDNSTAVGQAWPLWAKLGPVTQQQELWSQFTEHWPKWTSACEPPTDTATPCTGTPWAALAYAAAVQGDTTDAATYVDNARAVWSGRPWPWTVADSGWLALAESVLANAGAVGTPTDGYTLAATVSPAAPDGSM